METLLGPRRFHRKPRRNAAPLVYLLAKRFKVVRSIYLILSSRCALGTMKTGHVQVSAFDEKSLTQPDVTIERNVFLEATSSNSLNIK